MMGLFSQATAFPKENWLIGAKLSFNKSNYFFYADTPNQKLSILWHVRVTLTQ